MRLLGVREAATDLGLNASTVSRYLKDHPELNRASEGSKRPLVDPAELKAHRAQNVNGAMAGNHAGILFDETALADADDPPPAESPSGALGTGVRNPPARPPLYAKAKGAREAILAREAQLRLEEKLGRAVSKSTVEDAGFELGQLIQASLAERNRQLAEELVNQDDPRELRAALEASDRKLLVKLADELDRRLNPASEAEGANAA